MKIFLLSLLIFVLNINTDAQNLHLNLFAGTSNYSGDLQDKGFTLSQSHFAGGFGVSYDITDHFSVQSALTFGTISANDKYGRNKARNLNFNSAISEVNVGVQYFITPLSEHVLTPYVFAGLAVYHFNPYTTDTAGAKTYLKPLSTEGEGFIQGKNNYNLTQFAIPFGAGVKFSLSDNVNVGLEMGYRKLFTDYLDDVSTTYVDQSALLAGRGTEAVELAFRGDELKNAATTYPAGGTLRGSSTHKDWYYFTGLTASFRLFTGNGLGSGTGKHAKYGCPANVN
jgi:opacity protein-like surface antigen